MLLLTSTSDIVRLVTGSAAALAVHASWMDNASGTVTPGRLNSVSITTATTTTVVTSPGASVQRNVKSLLIRNTHASASTTVDVQHYDGTNSESLMSVLLLAGEVLVWNVNGTWIHFDANGAPYAYGGSISANLGITGTLAETMPRETCPEVNTTIAATGGLILQAIYLRAGQLVSNVSFFSATTAAGTPTHQLFGLYSAALALLATSADATTAAWAANTIKTLAMTTPYRVPTSGLYYLGISVAATTVPTLKGGTAKTGGQLAGTVPITNGTSASTGITAALPNPASALTVSTASIWGAVT